VFFIAVFIVAILSGATATVVGFGIGSLMTPLLAVKFGTTTAVALVTLPHAAATAVRCWRWRAHVDRTVLVRFGLLSAGGALAGALIYTRLGPGALTRPRWSPALDRRRAAHRLDISLATAWPTGRGLWPPVWILWRHRRQSRRSALGGVDSVWPSTAWIRRDRDGNWPFWWMRRGHRSTSGTRGE